MELKSVEWFRNASNLDIRKLIDDAGFENGRSIRQEKLMQQVCERYGYKNYSDIPTKLLTFEEFCNIEIKAKTPFNPHGYDFWTAESDYNEMINWR